MLFRTGVSFADLVDGVDLIERVDLADGTVADFELTAASALDKNRTC